MPTIKNDPYFQDIRGFLVVVVMRGHCRCVGVNTYSHQGYLKPGVHPEYHGIAYHERTGPPAPLPGEPKLGFLPTPINILPELLAIEAIHPTSLINFAKLYTVEHKVPVRFIGEVDPEHVQYIQETVSSVQESKTAISKRHSKGRTKDKDKPH
ncbi:DUF6590 domain-containing protein [Microdochium nivale]|nr:DUF6590 domain-containing protein [Microdochium nivale]